MINIGWKGTLVALTMFLMVLIFVPAPSCTKRQSFKIDDSLLQMSGSYCAEHEWKSVYAVWMGRR